MPRIPDDVLDSVFFMYRQTEDADTGENACGTGFVVGYPCSNPSLKGLHHFYAVSNDHVVKEAPVLRLHRRDGSTQAIGNDLDEWERDERTDIAIRPLEIDWLEYEIFFLGKDFFLRQAAAESLDVGVGDDVFMVGHFQDHGNIQKRNTPFARFGHISMIPLSMASVTRAHKRDISYCVDMRTRAGFSGSPVFLYRTPGSSVKSGVNDGMVNLATPGFMWLLGIDWGSFKETWTIEGKKLSAQGVSGMGVVTPAWNILSILERDVFVRQREDAERTMRPTNIQND